MESKGRKEGEKKKGRSGQKLSMLFLRRAKRVFHEAMLETNFKIRKLLSISASDTPPGSQKQLC